MKLTYRTVGDRESPGVLLLHGFMGSSHDWEEIADDLSVDCFCITPDLPGHGGSCLTYSPNDYTFPSTAASIIAVLDELGIESAVIAGYSMGGRIALFTALEYLTRTCGLFLESASAGIEDEAERRQRIGQDEMKAARLMDIGIERFVDEWYAQPLFESLSRDESTLRAIKTRRRNNNVRGLEMSLRHSGTGIQPSLWPRLPELVCPALFVHGTLDLKYAFLASKMAHVLPEARVVAVSDAGHAVHIEKPKEISGILHDFARRCWSHSEETDRNV